MRKITAGLIIIGDEILSGRTLDSNSNFIAKTLINYGIDLGEIRIISDNSSIIIKTVLKFHKKFTYVFTTGGIGPTHDDITSLSIAKAFKREYLINNNALKILKDYYPNKEINEGRKKMAKMPKGVKLILNPITAAPGFQLKNVFVLPGVPKIMQSMFIEVVKKLNKNKPKKIITIKTNLYESIMAKTLSIIQNKYKSCSIGSYPFFNFEKKSGGVNIVISSSDKKKLSLVFKEITKMISLLGGKILKV